MAGHGLNCCGSGYGQ